MQLLSRTESANIRKCKYITLYENLKVNNFQPLVQKILGISQSKHILLNLHLYLMYKKLYLIKYTVEFIIIFFNSFFVSK